MKKYIIAVIALLMVAGCSPKQSPESKKEIALFMGQEVKSYIQVLSPLDVNKVITEFPELRKKWSSIEQKYKLPKTEVRLIHNALNFHELFLLYHEMLSTDIDSITLEERKALIKKNGEQRATLRNSIDNEYWEMMTRKIDSPDYGENEVRALNGLRTNDQWFMFPRPSGLGGVVYANFDELVTALNRLTK